MGCSSGKQQMSEASRLFHTMITAKPDFSKFGYKSDNIKTLAKSIASPVFGGSVFLPVAKKGGWTRVIEVIAGYFIVGLIGFAIEGSLSQVTPQRWEFYALTVCLFLVFAFPGFVYRFLWRSPKG